MFDLIEVDLRTGHHKLVLKNTYGFAAYVFDNNLNLRILLEIDKNGDSLYWNYLPNTISSTENFTEKYHLFRKVPFDNSREILILDFDSSNNWVYWKDYFCDDDEFLSLYKQNIETGQKELIYRGSRDGPLSDVIFHPLTKRPLLVWTEFDVPKMIVLDSSIQQDVEFINKSIVEKRNHAIGFPILRYSMDFNTWIGQPLTNRRSPMYFLYDRVLKALKPLFPC